MRRCNDNSGRSICDRFEQKQAYGWVLTNPLNATHLRPDSTFIDGFSRAIYQKIDDFNSYRLRYQFWKSVYKCGAGTQWRTGTVSGSVKTHPHDCFCSKRFVFIASSIKSEQDPGVRDGHRVGRYGIKRGARMASDKYCAPPATAQPSPGPEFEHTRNIQFWSRFFSMFQGTHVT